MKLHRFVYGNLAFWLVLALSVNSAMAGTPGTCTDVTATPCGSGGVCTIKVSETTGPNPVTTVGNDNAAIQIKSGTRIEWSTSSGSFIVTFAASHPFPSATAGTFAGTPGHNSGDTATIADLSPPVCYQYSVEHCGSGHCAKIDPKVIVTNVKDGH
jgi:hypothetical protein